MSEAAARRAWLPWCAGIGVMLVLGLWLHWPSLHFPFSVDDTLHVAELEGREPLPQRSGSSLYVFVDDEAEPMGPVQGNLIPWWSADDLRVAFHRPLSSLTHWLDHAIHGADPTGFHATNLLLYGLALLAVGLFYRELALDSGRGPLALALAGAIFALDSAHIDNVGWIAGRYTLVTVFFSVLALLQYHRFRRDGSRRSLALGLAWLVAALFSSEAAVALAFWVGAYEVCVSRSPLLERARAMLPVAITIFLYLLYYKLSGYGTRSSAMYVDPLSDPARFLSYMANVAPMSLRIVLSSADLNLAMLRIEYARWLAPLAIALVLAPQLWRDRLSAFVLLGALLGLIPQSASAVREYALLLPSVAVAWVYGAFVFDIARDVAGWARRRTWPGAGRAAFGVARIAFAAAIIGVSLWLDPSQARRSLIPRQGEMARWRVQLAEQAALPPDAEIADSRVLLLTSPDPSMAVYLPIYRLQAGHPWPGAIWPLSISTAPHVLTRTGPRSFRYEIRSRSGFLHSGFAGMFNGDLDYPEGRRFRMGALEVEVLEAFQYKDDPSHRVRMIGVTIDRELDDPSVWLLAWDGERWARVAPPRAGGSMKLPRQRSGLPRG